MVSNRLNFCGLAVVFAILINSSLAICQDDQTLNKRISYLEAKIKELENRITKLETQVSNRGDISIPSEIDVSTPMVAARGFWDAMKANNVDLALKYYLTLEDAQSISPQLAYGIAEKLSKEVRQLQNSHINEVQGGTWLDFVIEEEEYSMPGHKSVVGKIQFSKNEQFRTLGIAFFQVRENVWKITDVD